MSEFKSLYIEGTKKTPKIDFNNLTGELILQGRSFPENVAVVYQPALDWIQEYIQTPRKTTNFHLKLEYFNSTTLFWIIKIVKLLGSIEKKESVLNIHIYFDDDIFDYEEADELKDVFKTIFNNFGNLNVEIGIKIHGVSTHGQDVDESFNLM